MGEASFSWCSTLLWEVHAPEEGLEARVGNSKQSVLPGGDAAAEFLEPVDYNL